MKENLDILKKSPLFYGLNNEELIHALKCLSAKKETFAKNDFIFSSGISKPSAGIILSGCVHIIKEDFWGSRSIIGTAGQGDIFGEAFALSSCSVIPVSVTAVSETELYMLNFNKITGVCSADCNIHSVIVSNLLRAVSQKNMLLTQKIEHMSCHSIREKLLSYLSEQAVKSNCNYFSINLNRQELADYLSVDRSAVSRELCRMRDDGLLLFNKNKFTLIQSDNN